MPGGWELIIILIMGIMVYGIPIAVFVYLILTLNAIRRDLAEIKAHLEHSSSNPQA
jgi:hypothetical protein